jgi:zinc/manganese transport system substrate-binding protein
MKRLSHWLLALAAFVFLNSSALAAGKVQVITSFSILQDLVQVVGAGRVEVHALVGPDEDAHVFEPKPTHAKRILQSQLVVMNGLGFEHWMAKLVKSSGYKGLVVQASEGVTARTMPAETGGGVETDPHAWQDPTNVILYVRNIAAGLSKLDPDGAASYRAHADSYVAELQKLDTWAQEQIATIPANKRKVITSHDAFGYFGAHYGVALLAPQGISTEAEPSAKGVAKLIRQIKQEQIKAVFLENMSNSKLITQIAKDTGVILGRPLFADALSKSNAEGASYLQLMRYNVKALVEGMQMN